MRAGTLHREARDVSASDRGPDVSGDGSRILTRSQACHLNWQNTPTARTRAEAAESEVI